MMAVPFAIPEDDLNDLITALIYFLSQSRLERSSDDNHKLRDCMEELVALLMEEVERRSLRSEYDNNLRRTLFLLRQSLKQFTSPNSGSPIIRARRRTSSESCCVCDDAKLRMRETDAADYSQVGVDVHRKITDFELTAIFKEDAVVDSLMGSIVSDGVEGQSVVTRSAPLVRSSTTLWTAIPLICMVGWHWFQTNYCM